MIRVRYHHKPADQSIEVTFKLITRSGKGKSRKRSQRSVEALPAMSLDNVGEEFAELVHREYHEANRRILLAVKAAKEAAVQAVPQSIPAMLRQADAAAERVSPEAYDRLDAKLMQRPQPPQPPEPPEPVIEIRPSRQRKAQDLSGPPKERTEADEVAEAMRLVEAANARGGLAS